MSATTSVLARVAALAAVAIVIVYTIVIQTKHNKMQKDFREPRRQLDRAQVVLDISTAASRTTAEQVTTDLPATSAFISTATTRPRTTVDPAFLLVERTPSPSRLQATNAKGGLAAFLFQTRHHVLADLQMYMMRKLATDLVAIELFVDGEASKEMIDVAAKHRATVHSFPQKQHEGNAGPSTRNAAVVNWAISTRAKQHLGNGTAILLLDGDVFPLTPFDSVTLLNSRDIVCRKHPAPFARFCWIGLICLSPRLYSSIGEFDVTPIARNGIGFDSGGKTIEFLLKYTDMPFSWMKETVLLRTGKDLFWGATDVDIQWIGGNFNRCDKCGPEIFVAPFNTSNAVFYHMISGTSEWRFGNQDGRRGSLRDSIMRSPYGPNGTLAAAELLASVAKVRQMETIPFSGNLTCARVCAG